MVVDADAAFSLFLLREICIQPVRFRMQLIHEFVCSLLAERGAFVMRTFTATIAQGGRRVEGKTPRCLGGITPGGPGMREQA